jgi:hypothetical protein
MDSSDRARIEEIAQKLRAISLQNQDLASETQELATELHELQSPSRELRRRQKLTTENDRRRRQLIEEIEFKEGDQVIITGKHQHKQGTVGIISHITACQVTVTTPDGKSFVRGKQNVKKFP